MTTQLGNKGSVLSAVASLIVFLLSAAMAQDAVNKALVDGFRKDKEKSDKDVS